MKPPRKASPPSRLPSPPLTRPRPMPKLPRLRLRSLPRWFRLSQPPCSTRSLRVTKTFTAKWPRLSPSPSRPPNRATTRVRSRFSTALMVPSRTIPPPRTGAMKSLSRSRISSAAANRATKVLINWLALKSSASPRLTPPPSMRLRPSLTKPKAPSVRASSTMQPPCSTRLPPTCPATLRPSRSATVSSP